jgi:dTDP-4-dehydrorhamnose reductase
MSSILLIGANGQLGWEVARRAHMAGLRCDALGKDELDVTEPDAVFRIVSRLSPSVAINAAAYTNVDRAESDASAFAVNRDGVAHVAQACGAAGIPLIHISTDYVFDGCKRTPYTEDDPVSPLGAYGRSKLAGEEVVRECCPKHVILRTAWVYGSHGHNFVKTMLRLGGERERLRVVSDQFGNPTFAGDLAEVVLTLAQRLQSGTWPDQGFGTFHCAGAGMMTWCDLARAIFHMAGPKLGHLPEIEGIATADCPTPAKRPHYSVLDCSRLARTHNIVMRSWELGLAEMLEAALGQPLGEGRRNSGLSHADLKGSQ